MTHNNQNSSADMLREDVGNIAILTLNRPEKLNAFTLEMRDILEKAVLDLREDPDLRMLLIRARGRFFTAGLDLKAPALPVDSERPELALSSMRRDYRLRFHMLFDEIEAIEKPVMMAIHAPCLGLGVELAGSCDFRVASESALFGLPEINLGVIAGGGGVSRFTRLCGVGWSKWLNVAGEQIDARTALTAGFVQAVLPDENFEEQVLELCQRIVSRPAAPQQAAKLAVDLAHDLDRQSARHVERLANAPLIIENGAAMARQLEKKS